MPVNDLCTVDAQLLNHRPTAANKDTRRPATSSSVPCMAALFPSKMHLISFHFKTISAAVVEGERPPSFSNFLPKCYHKIIIRYVSSVHLLANSSIFQSMRGKHMTYESSKWDKGRVIRNRFCKLYCLPHLPYGYMFSGVIICNVLSVLKC